MKENNYRLNNFAEDQRSDNSGLALPPPRARRNGTADERSAGPHKVSKLPPAPIVTSSVNISSNPERARQYNLQQPPSYKLKNNLNGFNSEPEQSVS